MDAQDYQDKAVVSSASGQVVSEHQCLVALRGVMVLTCLHVYILSSGADLWLQQMDLIRNDMIMDTRNSINGVAIVCWYSMYCHVPQRHHFACSLY